MSYPKPCVCCGEQIEDADDATFWHGYGNCVEITDEMWKQWEMEALVETFDEWWQRDGKFFDPDTDDVPWFDKRQFLAEYAFERAKAQSRNYYCDDSIFPGIVHFANGRVVRLVERSDGVKGYYLQIELIVAPSATPANPQEKE